MNNVFNRVQMLETSDDCDKFSKRFLYKNLVGGTATTGTDIKQTQRLIKGSADKPLSAVGTLTSLLCNSAKVMEKLLRHVITRRTSVRRGYLPDKCTYANKESLFASVTWLMRLPRRIQRMLLVMTIPVSCREAHKCRFLFNLIRRSLEKFFKKNFRDDTLFCFGFAKVLALALLFTIATTAESRAECAVGSIACGDDCAADDGKSTCHWEIDSNGKMTVTGSGAMKDYKVVDGIAEFTPWSSYAGGGKISTVDIKGINHVGSWTFRDSSLQRVSFDDTVTSIGGYAFRGNQLKSLSLPDKIESIGQSAFNSNQLTSVVLPDSIKSIGSWAFNSNNLTSVVLPDSLEIFQDTVFYNNPLSEIVIPGSITNKNYSIYRAFGGDAEMLENLRIECKGDNASCQKLNKLLKKYGYRYDSETGWLYMDISHRLFDIGQENCDSTNFYWNGKECLREPDVTKRTCCADVCKDMGGWCNRIRYTPAEAAEVLRDDDKNEVTITFRK